MLLRLASGVVLLVCAPCLVAAADYPLRPLRLVVPFPPGGGADFMGRLVAQGLAAKRGYAVVVDNRGGAGGAIGAGMVAKATPDGYTLVLANNTTHVMVTVFNNVPPYDPLRDFTPVALTGYAPQLLVCALSIVPRNVAELIAYARTRLAGYKAPKAIRFIDALPMNSAGKILKRELRTRFAPVSS